MTSPIFGKTFENVRKMNAGASKCESAFAAFREKQTDAKAWASLHKHCAAWGKLQCADGRSDPIQIKLQAKIEPALTLHRQTSEAGGPGCPEDVVVQLATVSMAVMVLGRLHPSL